MLVHSSVPSTKLTPAKAGYIKVNPLNSCTETTCRNTGGAEKMQKPFHLLRRKASCLSTKGM